MSKQYENYKIYRALLHLYPKAHRTAYGEQMVQTLDDILADKQTSGERFIVWLRLAFELPINIIEENLNSMGEISVNRLTKLTNKQYLYILLAMFVIVGYVLMAILWQHDHSQIKSLNSQLQTVTQNEFAMNGGGYSAVTIVPSENAVYFPLANLKVPATTLNEGLVYSYAPAHTIPGDKKVFPAEIDISTHDLAYNDFSTTQQFDCSEVAYADFVTPSYPVNPMVKLDGKVKLSDGRIMNAYYSPKSPSGCKAAWKINDINSKAIADSLMQAVSY